MTSRLEGPKMPTATTMLAVAASVVILAAAGPGNTATAQTYTMKIGTATINDDQHEWMKRFQARMEKRAGDRLEVELYPASQLGLIPRQIEGMQLGTQEAWVGPPGFLVGIDQRFMVLDAPGLFVDKDHGFRTLRDNPDLRRKFLALGEAKKLKGISIYISSQTLYLSRKPIRTLADFRGKKIRVLASRIERKVMEELGASAIPMPLGEVLPALQRGTIDGVKSAITIFLNFKYYNVATAVTTTRESVIPTVAVVSKDWFDKLPGDLQEAILDEAKALEPEIQAFNNRYKAGLFKKWTEVGGELIELPKADQEAMIARLSGVGAEVVSDIPEAKALYEEVVEAAKSAM